MRNAGSIAGEQQDRELNFKCLFSRKGWDEQPPACPMQAEESCNGLLLHSCSEFVPRFEKPTREVPAPRRQAIREGIRSLWDKKSWSSPKRAPFNREELRNLLITEKLLDKFSTSDPGRPGMSAWSNAELQRSVGEALPSWTFLDSGATKNRLSDNFRSRYSSADVASLTDSDVQSVTRYGEASMGGRSA